MKEVLAHCRALSDEDLTRELRFIAERERRDVAGLLAHLAEYDRRRLAQKTGHESTFTFCLRVLRCDEASAYRRVHAARVVRRYPEVLPMIADGSLTLTSVLLLSPILNDSNHAALFNEAKGKTKREVESLVVAYDPRPATADSLRRLPTPPPAWSSFSPAPSAPVSSESSSSIPVPESRGHEGLEGILPPIPPREWQAVMPLSLDRVRIGFDAAVALMRLIDRARQVLRHKYPEGRLEDIVTDALEVLLERKDPQRRLAFKRTAFVRDKASAAPAGEEVASAEPRFLRILKSGRYIPARVKQAVWQRDGGRCAWRLDDGTVCGSRDWLEYDHLRPFAKGGRSDSPRNIRLLCRAHNQAARNKEFPRLRSASE